MLIPLIQPVRLCGCHAQHRSGACMGECALYDACPCQRIPTQRIPARLMRRLVCVCHKCSQSPFPLAFGGIEAISATESCDYLDDPGHVWPPGIRIRQDGQKVCSKLFRYFYTTLTRPQTGASALPVGPVTGRAISLKRASYSPAGRASTLRSSDGSTLSLSIVG